MSILLVIFITWMFIGMVVSWESYCKKHEEDYRDNDDDINE